MNLLAIALALAVAAAPAMVSIREFDVPTPAVATPDGKLYLAESGVNKVAVATPSPTPSVQGGGPQH